MSLAIPFFVTLLISLLAWLFLMLALRRANFREDGTRRKEAPLKGGDKRSDEIQYHNAAIYRDVEFFFKISLAILGGVAYLSIQATPVGHEVVSILLRAAGLLELLAAIIFSMFVVYHQKSKIERWTNRYEWWHPILNWQEYWMIAAMLCVGATFCFAMIPAIAGAIPLGP